MKIKFNILGHYEKGLPSLGSIEINENMQIIRLNIRNHKLKRKQQFMDLFYLITGVINDFYHNNAAEYNVRLDDFKIYQIKYCERCIQVKNHEVTDYAEKQIWKCCKCGKEDESI